MWAIGKFFYDRLICHIIEVIDHLDPLITQKAAVLVSSRSFHARNLAAARQKEPSQGRDSPRTVLEYCLKNNVCWKPREWWHLAVPHQA